MKRPAALLSMLVGLLSARGLAAEALDSWRAWVVFKHYARLVDETPDPGISVQIERHRVSGEATLYMVRQVVEDDRDRLEPVGGVVCELTFSAPPATVTDFEAWSFEYGTFEHFVDLVEGEPGFADLIARRPTRSAVYWEDA
jgi:hypothetical protein